MNRFAQALAQLRKRIGRRTVGAPGLAPLRERHVDVVNIELDLLLHLLQLLAIDMNSAVAQPQSEQPALGLVSEDARLRGNREGKVFVALVVKKNALELVLERHDLLRKE